MPQIPDLLPFSPIHCLSCQKAFTPDSFVSMCPLYLHVRCGQCLVEQLDQKCPCFIEIEWILKGLIPNKDVTAKIAFMALDYQ